jgi:isochorismate synthase
MTDEEISNLTTIDAFIQRKQPFAVYRIPGEKVPRLLTQAEGAVRLIYDLKELNGQRGFVIAPFQVSETCPVVLIQPDQWGQPLPIDNDTAEEREVALRMQGQESFLTSSPLSLSVSSKSSSCSSGEINSGSNSDETSCSVYIKNQ